MLKRVEKNLATLGANKNILHESEYITIMIIAILNQTLG
jgi:hypothetical protein